MTPMHRRGVPAALLLLAAAAFASCSPEPLELEGFAPPRGGERTRVLELYPGVTATIVTPATLDPDKRIDLILYALPNGNTTAQTIGRTMADGVDWHFDIQHIGAQTRALRTRGLSQAVVAYLEADTKSWPAWRSTRGYDYANPRIVQLVDAVIAQLGNPPHLGVTLTGHSGGGSLAWGFIDGQDSLPPWLERIAFLDSNYSFEPRHGEKILRWLDGDPHRSVVVLAYDDREITLDGKKVIPDTVGGTWRASQRMIAFFQPARPLAQSTLGEFIRYAAPQIEILLHPNPENRILHTELIGEFNGYMHALLVGRPSYREPVLQRSRAYTRWIEGDVILPPAAPPAPPARSRTALTGAAFNAAIATLPREQREAAVKRELLAGNIPSFLRALRTVTVTMKTADSVTHTLSYQVMPDYLAIGSDDDYARMPMNPYTAEAFTDAFGYTLPTRKMVNDIWAAADYQLDPRPLTVARDSAPTFYQHHGIIEQQLADAGAPRGAFVAGIKKDVILSNRLLEKPNRVCIYGWHYTNGDAIQPAYAGHVDWYVDYSHGIRPVRRAMTLDGKPTTFEKVLTDPVLRALLSDEGELKALHYGR